MKEHVGKWERMKGKEGKGGWMRVGEKEKGRNGMYIMYVPYIPFISV